MRTNAFIPTILAAACFAGPASAKDGSRQIQTSPEFEVTVYVVQSCQTPDVEKVALATAAQLFARIDVLIRFVHAEPPRNDADAIVLRFVERAPGGTGPYVLGAAWVNGKPWPQANVYCDRVMAFHDSRDCRESGRLLGYAAAHELGHVLRTEPGHSPAGVMRACWRQRDILPMLQGAVAFLPADAERIREARAKRQTLLARAGEN